MKKNWIAGITIALVLTVPMASALLKGPDAKDVEVQRAQPRTLHPSILASGTLTYESQVTLAPETIGRVTEVLVKEGEQVRKGQVLLRLDAEASQAEVAQLAANRRQAELKVELQKVSLDAVEAKTRRYEALRKSGLIEATKYDELVAQRDAAAVELRVNREAVRQAQAQILQAQQRLSKTEIRAPIDGQVTSISIKAGETAVPSAMSIAGSSLMVISDTRSMLAEVNVDETDIGRIRIGQPGKVVPAAYPDTSLQGTVQQVAVAPRQVAGQSRSYAVKIRLAAGQADFRPGMSCRAEIFYAPGDSAKSLGVPVQAVQYEEGERGALKASVFVVEQGKAARREVRLGVADDSYVEIASGLQRDELVVTGPTRTLRFLRDGEPVAPSVPPVARDTRKEPTS